MSQGLTNTKRRINSITSTKKITKAMELVATVKLKKWKDSMENIVSYLDVMKEIISSCASTDNDLGLPELNQYKDANDILYVVVTSSLGLCGGYNYNLFKALNAELNKNDKVIVIGTKGFVKYSHEENEVNSEYVALLEHFNYSSVGFLKDVILQEYLTGKYKKVVLVSTVYKNSLTFIPTFFQVLPLEKLEKDESERETLFEPTKEEVLQLIIPKYINTFLYGRLTEAMVLGVPYTASDILDLLGLRSKETLRAHYLDPAIELGLVVMTLPEEPTSRNQRYIRK